LGFDDRLAASNRAVDVGAAAKLRAEEQFDQIDARVDYRHPATLLEPLPTLR
jgi:hypothetical protein